MDSLFDAVWVLLGASYIALLISAALVKWLLK